MDNSGFHQGHCKQNPNCYYKQLQRLKQENEALRDIITDGRKENKRLIQECRNVDKYRSALEDIKNIANEPCIEDEDCETCDSDCMCKEILNKIDEVLN